jgi:hypothetical protein
MKKINKYAPNHISIFEWICNSILSIFLLVYGTLGIINDDLYIPSIGNVQIKGSFGVGDHLHGTAAKIMFIAFIFVVLNRMSVVIIDFFDKRNIKLNYKVFSRVTLIFGCIFFVWAIESGGWK